MLKEENDCHSQILKPILKPLFSNHSETIVLKMKVDIYVFSAVEFFFLLHAIIRKQYFRH